MGTLGHSRIGKEIDLIYFLLRALNGEHLGLAAYPLAILVELSLFRIELAFASAILVHLDTGERGGR